MYVQYVSGVPRIRVRARSISRFDVRVRNINIFIYVFYVFICLGEGSLYIQSVIALINLRHS